MFHSLEVRRRGPSRLQRKHLSVGALKKGAQIIEEGRPPAGSDTVSSGFKSGGKKQIVEIAAIGTNYCQGEKPCWAGADGNSGKQEGIWAFSLLQSSRLKRESPTGRT